MSSESLEKFGKLLMRKVRDKSIEDWHKILSGEMRGASAEEVRRELANLGPTQLEVLRHLIPQIVDTALHHLLWTLDQTADVQLLSTDSVGTKHSVKEASDGLPGELYGNNGWIARFSGHPQSSD